MVCEWACGLTVTIAIVIWLYIAYLLLRVSREKYGGKWTMTNPPIIGGLMLILLILVLSNPLSLSIVFNQPTTLQMEFGTGLIAIKVVAGILLLIGMYKIYGITFSTTGFMRELEED